MDAIIWVAALSSFSDPNLGTYPWRAILEDAFTAYSLNSAKSYTEGWMRYSLQPFGYYWHIEFTANMNSFLNDTNNFDLDTIASSLQDSVSSTIYYSVLGGAYLDESNQFVVINDTSSLYLGTSGSPQTQNWESTALCRPYMFSVCLFQSDNVSNIESWDYDTAWDSILPNTYDIDGGNFRFSEYTQSAYEQTLRMAAIYSNKNDYQTDYESNGKFSLNGIRESLYNNYPELNANADLIDVNCLAVLTVCDDADMCAIQLPWCPIVTANITTTTTITTTETTTNIITTDDNESQSNINKTMMCIMLHGVVLLFFMR
eukprot:66367_1